MEGLLLTFNWLFDNGLNFVPHLFVGLLIGLAFAVRAKSIPWMIAIVAVLGVMWGALAVSSFNHAPLEDAKDVGSGTVVKTLTLNLQGQKKKYEKVADYIWGVDADIVCLQEASGDWHTAVSTLLRLYPHALQSAKGGTILLSKHPMKVLDINLAQATRDSIGVTLKDLDRPVDVVCLHLTQPTSPSQMAVRNQELGYLARTVFKSKSPVILLGDFNASTRSPSLFRFMQQAGVKTAGPGFPPANTWPGGMPFLGIRIDHVMFSPPFEQFRRKVGPNLGTSHRPLLADLVLPKAPGDIKPGPGNAKSGK